jgi:hypothetical protein
MLECGFSESQSFTGGVNEIVCIVSTFSYDWNNISKRRLFFFKICRKMVNFGSTGGVRSALPLGV